MKKVIGGTAALAGLAVLLIVASALATPNSGLTSTTIAQATLDEIDVKSKTDTSARTREEEK